MEGEDDQDFEEQLLPEVEFIESHLTKTSEYLLKEQRRREEIKMRRILMKRRWESRTEIDEFVRAILNMDVLDRFADCIRSQFSKLPLNFEAGHFDYLSKWEHLFLYETFNMLLNSRRSASKEDEHAKRMAAEAEFLKSTEKNKYSNKKLNWIGYLVGSTKETFFQQVRMYEKPPSASDSVTDDNGPSILKQLRENDLLILSQEEINLKGYDDIKKISSLEFLRSLLLKHNAMFGFVTKKAG